MSKQILLGMDLTDLESVVRDFDMPRFTAKQIAQWLYARRVKSVDEMTNISLKFREMIKAKYEIGSVPPVESKCSVDGTIKYLYPVDNKFIEAVYIPETDRATLCISSQIGCKMNCKFCMTGKMGFKGNLSVGQILNQFISVPEFEKITNIVVMGMGEPLDNIENVLKALSIIQAPYGFGWSPKRITLSSVGLKKSLKHFIETSNCHLAISLHSPVPSQRAELMPAEKAFSIIEIIDLVKQYDFSKQRRLSFEYIMFKGLNDSIIYAKELVKLLRGVDCRVNLIRFHSIPGVSLQGSSDETIETFKDYLVGHGLFSTIRASRGEDIFAACGMLSTAQHDVAKNID